MKRTLFQIVHDQSGSVIIIALCILVIVTIIGVTSIKTSNFELNVSGNEALYTKAFFEADSGTEAGLELVEQNIEKAGFDDDGSGYFRVGEAAGLSFNFYMNPVPPTIVDLTPGDTNRDAFFPGSYTADQPHTNLRMGGTAMLNQGAAIQMAAGYEGIGKGTAGGGGLVMYEIGSQRISQKNSNAAVNLRWRHVD